MKAKLTAACLIIGASLAGASMISYAADDTDSDRSHPKAFVKDSKITTKIKAKLAAEHLPSLARMHVDTDANGVVWLSGTARSQDEIDKAVSIARSTEGVASVNSNVKVKADD
jgi:hyperosmotically inducible periplasmic protein